MYIGHSVSRRDNFEVLLKLKKGLILCCCSKPCSSWDNLLKPWFLPNVYYCKHSGDLLSLRTWQFELLVSFAERFTLWSQRNFVFGWKLRCYCLSHDFCMITHRNLLFFHKIESSKNFFAIAVICNWTFKTVLKIKFLFSWKSFIGAETIFLITMGKG